MNKIIKNITPSDTIIELLQLLPMLEANIEISKMRADIIRKALDCLTPVEKTIIVRMIIKNDLSDDVSFDLNIERSCLYYHRKNAINKIHIALYGYPIEQLFDKEDIDNETTENT